jgi:DNA-directed RNA polymerase I, II, and III subunit RPABC2
MDNETVDEHITNQGKFKAKVMDDVEDAELAVEKKEEVDIGDDDIIDPDDIDDDGIVGSDYEEEGPDDEPILPDEVNGLSQQNINENLYDTNYYREIKVVPDDMRITSDIMTMFEFSEIIGIRTLQIEKGSPVFTDVSDLHIPYDMAIKELFDRKSPLKVIRKISKFEQEEWKANDMGFPFDTRSSF